METWMVVAVGIWVAAGIIHGLLVGYVASEKGYSYDSWFVVGFLLAIMALIAVAGLPNRKGYVTTGPEATTWECPECRGSVPSNSYVCQGCGYDLTAKL